MAFNFPSPANVGDVYSSGGITFQFDGIAWNYVNTTAVLAYNQANAAYTRANSAARITFGTVIANGTSIIATSNNDTLTLISNANISMVGLSATKNIIFDLADTGVVYSTYGNSTLVPVFTVDNKGRLTSVTNTAIDTTIATAAFAAANTMVMKAGNTMTGNLVFSGANITFLSSATSFANLGIYFSNTPTVGIESAIYANAANILVFATQKTERLRIDSGGNVIVAAGRTGLLTATPTATLQVSGNITTLAIDAAGVNLAPTIVAAFGAANTMVMKAGNTMTGNLVFSAANITFLSSATSFANLGIYFSNTPTSGIESAIYANAANTLVFATNKLERMRIENNGRVGIGTGLPNATMQIAGNVSTFAVDVSGVNVAPTIVAAFAAANTMVMKAGNTMTGNLVFSAANITFLSSATSFSNLGIYFSNTPTVGVESAIYSNAANILVFATQKLERVRIDAGGRLNVGTIDIVQFSTAAYDTSNAAFGRANAANLIANLAYDKANTANITADSAFARANAANLIANLAYDKANTANVIASGAYDKANTANVTANSAFAKANLSAPIASPTFTGTVTSPSPLILLKVADPSEGGEITFEKSSSSNLSGNLTLDLFGNLVRIFETTGTNRGFFLDITKANTGVAGEILHTNNWFNFISTSGDPSAAFNKANTANITADSAFARANAANLIANLAYDKANTANITADAAFARANAANLIANLAYDKANTANVIASGAYDKANSANLAACGAFAAANTMVMKTGNTMTGNLVMSGANITFVTATNSGIYWGGTGLSFIHSPAANTLVFGTSSIEDMRIDSSGNVGIGTTAPAATLDVVGSFSDAKANTLSQTLTDGASIAWDASLGRVAVVTLGGTRTLANATNLRVGTYILRVQQNTSGGSTLTFGRQYKFTANVAPTLTSAANSVDIFSFVSDGTNMYGAMIPDVRS